MAEYIDKTTLINEVEHLRLFDYADKNAVRDLARSIPTADVAPVVHGHWDENKCTVCGGQMCCEIDGEQLELDCVGYNFCPNCGARMDGKNDDVYQKRI